MIYNEKIMEFDFLKQFQKRMKYVGNYALIFKNSMQKQTWKQYGIEDIYEQTNLIFSVLLFIMEQSLKDDNCTIDDIGYFIDSINTTYYKKELTYDMCKDIAEFIVAVVICDDGKAMYFKGYNYEEVKYEDIHISFITSEVKYLQGDIKRVTYRLTEDGYNLLISTLEIESNMKLTIQEMIFKMHLEKASYDKAADDIKNIFNQLRIQLQKISDAMKQIRQNALTYSITDYEKLLEQNINTIDQTRDKFLDYREYVKKLVKDIENQNLKMEALEENEVKNLYHLKIIEDYLNRSIDEYQKILLNHLDLKSMYTKELELLSAMSLISRFQITKDFYSKILEKPETVCNLDSFLGALFLNDCEKIYNTDKAFAYQKNIEKKENTEDEIILDFDSEEWIEEQNRILLEKWKVYQNSVEIILKYAILEGEITLSEIKNRIDSEEKEVLIPTMEIFREIMIELIKERFFDIDKLTKEMQEHFSEVKKEFQISHCLLKIIDESDEFSKIKEIQIYKKDEGEVVEFENVVSKDGKTKKIYCSETIIKVIERI